MSDHATTVVSGLCSDLERKNAESIAYHFGLERKTIQHFIGESQWDDAPLRLEMANQIAQQLGTDDGMLIFDPSAFPKSGKESVGVTRQWCGRLGKIDNCQVGVFMAYASSKGHALVDGDLYLPKEWINDKKRLNKAGVPKHTSVADLEIPPPEYAGFGRPPVRPSVRIDKWTASQPASSWQQIDVRDCEKGPLLIEILKGHVETSRRSRGGCAEETCVVIRYRDRDEVIVKQDYYLSNAPYETSVSEFARVAKAEHRIEECFDRGEGETGMADYEVRGWVGWHHHQTLSMLASWFLNVETRRSEKKCQRSHSIKFATASHRSFAAS